MFSVELRYRARKIYRSVKQIVELVSNVLLFLASFLAIILVIYRFGFDMPADYSHEIYYTIGLSYAFSWFLVCCGFCLISGYYERKKDSG